MALYCYSNIPTENKTIDQHTAIIQYTRIAQLCRQWYDTESSQILNLLFLPEQLSLFMSAQESLYNTPDVS